MPSVKKQHSVELDGEMGLGEKLRSRRQELSLTLQDVASRAGFSVGFISQVERGITVPSLTSLVAVCKVLGLDMAGFFRSATQVTAVTRHDHREVFRVGSAAVSAPSYERLSAAFPGNVLRTTLIHKPPGFRSETTSHEGEEIFYIVEGSITLELDGEVIVLETGDTAHFPSLRTHATWNHTTLPATVLHTCTMDVFGDDARSVDPNYAVIVTRSASRRKPRKSSEL